MASAVVAAGGAGERLGAGMPKALVPLAGRPMIGWCLDALAATERGLEGGIAAPPGPEREIGSSAEEFMPDLRRTVVGGGENRSESVANALGALEGPSELLVHDAARPLATTQLFDRCLERLGGWGCDGVVAAARAVDTVKEADA